MSEKSMTKTILAFIIILVALCAVLIWFLGRSKTTTGRPEGQSAVQQQEGIVVTLGTAAQQRGDIVTAPVEAMTYAGEIRAYGSVLQIQNLTELQNNYIQAKIQAAKAVVSLESSRKEYERLKALNEDNKNISDKALQAAWSALRSDEENVRASQEAMVIMEDTARQQWGRVIAQWMLKGSPALRRLLQQEEVLIQLTLPAGVRVIRMPERISLSLADGSTVSASFISLSPRTNPHIQGISLFYEAPSAGKLLSGMNVTAEMPSSGTQSGFFVPASAVIWLQDKAWVYLKKNETGFSRVEVPVSNPLNEGYFVSDVFSSGDQLVVKGAQALLSEESMPKTSGGGGE
jgi:hypothetical protein